MLGNSTAMQANKDVRAEIKTAGVKYWQIADVLGMADGNFSRRLRKELPDDEKQKILNIIKDLKACVCNG
jgi:predicted XRE-type DNA-binding protein